MRPEAYADDHAASRRTQDRGADRRIAPQSLRALLRWANAAYCAETPDLAHSGGHFDDDGTPTMSARARAYLALTGTDPRPDDWVRIASRVDEDGFYRTPLRRAIETLPVARRLFARDLVPEVLVPSEIATLHGIPSWCAGDVTHRTLSMLWTRYSDRPIPESGPRSDAQLDAEAKGRLTTRVQSA